MIISVKERSKKGILLGILVLFIMIIFSLSARYRVVYLQDEDSSRKVVSFTDHAESILNFYHIPYSEQDKIEKTVNPDNSLRIEIIRAKNIIIQVDGKEITTSFTNEKVEDILKNQSIHLQPHDLVTPSLSAVLMEHEKQILIQRVHFSQEEKIMDTPQEVTYRYTPLLKMKKEKVLSQGSPNKIKQTLQHRFVDGQLTQTAVLSENKVEEGAPKVILTGNPEYVISPLNFGSGNPNQLPSHATLFQSNAVATAYTARDGAKTASGRSAMVGHVAVDPKKIPYGTKLYITSTTGSFIYGYAIAADTGGFVESGNADIDLFFDSYEESCLFGKQAVNIYLVD